LICERVLEECWTLAEAAQAAGCSERTAAKWLKRFREGDRELLDRSSRPRRSPQRLPAERVQVIEALRRLRMTAAEIAEILSLPRSTVSLWLKRIGLGRRSRLDPPEPPNRYERRHPGELVHVDIKRLGRISARGAGHRVLGHRASQHKQTLFGHRRGATGHEYVHVIIDDHSHLAYAEVLDGLSARCAVDFLSRAVVCYAERGVEVRSVMTDNGACYVADAYRQALRELGLHHLRIRPRTTAHQRQGRALHPDAPQRMGVCAHLPQLTGAHRSVAGLPQALQLHSSARLSRPPGAGLETEQPR
jgi:transposase